jgi:hypothetical protein
MLVQNFKICLLTTNLSYVFSKSNNFKCDEFTEKKSVHVYDAQ